MRLELMQCYGAVVCRAKKEKKMMRLELMLCCGGVVEL